MKLRCLFGFHRFGVWCEWELDGQFEYKICEICNYKKCRYAFTRLVIK